MQTRSITPKGSSATLFASFLHFDLSFTLWVLLGALGIYITKDLKLNAFQQGLMVAIPTLIAIIYAATSFLPAIGIMAALLVSGVAFLGMGNGAVFQLVPQRFQTEIGVATGIVGAFGGLGGFLLPTLLGGVKQLSGSYGIGLVVLALFALTALIALRLLVAFRASWRFSGKAAVLVPAIED